MKKKALKVLLRYIDNSKEANDALSELLVIFNVSGSLPLTDDIIAQIALDYLKEVGSVDRKDLIYHDFTKGAMAYRDEQKRRQ